MKRPRPATWRISALCTRRKYFLWTLWLFILAAEASLPQRPPLPPPRPAGPRLATQIPPPPLQHCESSTTMESQETLESSNDGESSVEEESVPVVVENENPAVEEEPVPEEIVQQEDSDDEEYLHSSQADESKAHESSIYPRYPLQPPAQPIMQPPLEYQQHQPPPQQYFPYPPPPQYYHQGPPPRQQYPPPRIQYRQQQHQKPPLLNRFLNNLNRGLEKLADWEDRVTEKAQLVLKTGAASAAATVPSWSRQKHYQQPKPAPLLDMTRFEKYVEAPKASTNPFDENYRGDEAATRANADKIATAKQQTPRAFASQRNDWNQLAANPIRAGAAADSPPPSRTALTWDDVEDDDEKDSFLKSAQIRVGKVLNRIPRLLRRDSSGYAMATLDAWQAREDRDKEKSKRWFATKRKPEATVVVTGKEEKTPMDDILERCDDGKSTRLLSKTDRQVAESIGSNQAAWDMIALACLLLGIRQLPGLHSGLLPTSWQEVITLTVPSVLRSLVDSLTDDKLAPVLFLGMFVALQTGKLQRQRATKNYEQNGLKAIHENTEYSAMLMRLSSGIQTSATTLQQVAKLGKAQFDASVEASRISRSTLLLVVSLIVMSANFIRPVFFALLEAGHEWLLLAKYTTRFGLPNSDKLLKPLYTAWTPMAQAFSNEFQQILSNPAPFMYGLAIVACIMLSAMISSFSMELKPNCSVDPEEQSTDSESGLHGLVDNLGVSGASRLAVLQDKGGVEGLLERLKQQLSPAATQEGVSIPHVLIIVLRTVVALALLTIPVDLSSRIVFSSPATFPIGFPTWKSTTDVAAVMCFFFALAWPAIQKATSLIDSNVSSFLTDLSDTVQEQNKIQQAPPSNIQQHATVSPSSGLAVHDLWAAHTSKRAWAVRGASLECKNGEVVLVLGDDASGKSRFLTAIGEMLFEPPKRSRTTNVARGTILVGGLETTKWDRRDLRQRIGLLLNDVRTGSDLSQALSSMTLEDILDPLNGSRGRISNTISNSDVECIALALKIAGLGNLLNKLPSKLSTVVTANEDDLSRPSPLRPLYHLLSPAEWSKLIFARLLSQTLHRNNNAMNSPDKITNSLSGSVLLLDDVTLHWSDVEEMQLFDDLRKTAAATVLSSNRWSSGRFADRIVVLNDGVVVETGTHAELLGRGPQRSIYAAKWHVMNEALMDDMR